PKQHPESISSQVSDSRDFLIDQSLAVGHSPPRVRLREDHASDPVVRVVARRLSRSLGQRVLLLREAKGNRLVLLRSVGFAHPSLQSVAHNVNLAPTKLTRLLTKLTRQR